MRTTLIVGAAVLLLVFSAPAQALELHHGKQQSADAEFHSTSGCIDTDVFLLAVDVAVGTDVFSDGVRQQTVPGDHASDLFLGIERLDHCTHTELTGAFVDGLPIPDADFEVADDLTSASLSTTVVVHDDPTDTDLSVGLDLHWDATAPATRENGLELTDTVPGRDPFVIRIGDSGLRSQAEAVGSVTVGGKNMTPNPSDGASLFSGVFHFVAIGTPPS
jgi:hypothetical protein